jgi:hypothetical protein
MARRPTSRSDAERLRLHREEFRYALEHNLTILQARQRLGQLRMAELEERVHPPLKPAIGLCGTAAPASRADRPSHAASDRQSPFWWQRD